MTNQIPAACLDRITGGQSKNPAECVSSYNDAIAKLMQARKDRSQTVGGYASEDQKKALDATDMQTFTRLAEIQTQCLK